MRRSVGWEPIDQRCVFVDTLLPVPGQSVIKTPCAIPLAFRHTVQTAKCEFDVFLSVLLLAQCSGRDRHAGIG